MKKKKEKIILDKSFEEKAKRIKAAFESKGVYFPMIDASIDIDDTLIPQK